VPPRESHCLQDLQPATVVVRNATLIISALPMATTLDVARTLVQLLVDLSLCAIRLCRNAFDLIGDSLPLITRKAGHKEPSDGG